MNHHKIIDTRAAILAVARDNGVVGGFERAGDGCRLLVHEPCSPADIATAMAESSKPALRQGVANLHVQCGMDLVPLTAGLRRSGKALPTVEAILPGFEDLAGIRTSAAEWAVVYRMWLDGPQYDGAVALLHLCGRLANQRAGEPSRTGAAARSRVRSPLRRSASRPRSTRFSARRPRRRSSPG